MIENALSVMLVLPICAVLSAFSAELLLGLRRTPSIPVVSQDCSTVVLVPAHNEAGGIGGMIAHLSSCLPERARIVVIADNCSDNTAELAEDAGAEVIQRSNPLLRGKGFALDRGMKFIQAYEPDCVIVLDADCYPAQDALTLLRDASIHYGRPAQGAYLMTPCVNVGPITKFSSFAFMIKNLVRQRGMTRIARTALLTGSGMAFPIGSLTNENLATSEIVEDLSLGLSLAQKGLHPLFVEQARIFTSPAPNDNETVGQRRRWEHGFVALALKRAIPLIAEGLRRGDRGEMWLGVHLLIPPLSLLLVITLASLVATMLGYCAAVSGPVAPALISAFMLMALVSVGLAWISEGRPYLRWQDIAQMPAYITAKIRVHLALIFNRETGWHRTGR